MIIDDPVTITLYHMGNALLTRLQNTAFLLESFTNYEFFSASGNRSNRRASATLSFEPTFVIADIIIGVGPSNNYEAGDTVILYSMYIPASGFNIQYGNHDVARVVCNISGNTINFSANYGVPNALGIAILL